MPLISIVIPVYGAEAFLPRCLDSVLAQTFSDWECILVEDGSPDGSAAICDEYAARDARFRVLHQKNQGGSIARNNGVKMAQGEYLVFLDNDDAFAPQLLESALRIQRRQPDSVVLWGYTCSDPAWPDSPVEFKRRERFEASRLYMESQLLFAWNKFYSLPFLKSIGLDHEDTVYGSDTVFTVNYIRAWLKARPTGAFYQSRCALHYYEPANPNSETAHFSESYCQDELALIGQALDWFTNDFETKPEDLALLCHSLLKTAAGALYIQQKNAGIEAAKASLEDPVLQKLCALAKKHRCRTPILGAVAGRHAKRAIRLGHLVMEGNDHTYQRLCRLWELLRL